MFSTAEVLSALTARLPELEWRLREIGSFACTQLPRGLFQCAQSHARLTGVRCVSEIRQDMVVLARQEELLSARFLADKISQKINVLLQLCRMSDGKAAHQPRVSLGVQCISTRQQWLEQLCREIRELTAQQQALQVALETSLTKHALEASLTTMQRELGEITCHLAAAEEAYMKACGGLRRDNCQ